MDWIENINELTDVEAASCMALAIALAAIWWLIRQRRVEREQAQARPTWAACGHGFACETLIKRMKRERKFLFTNHRVPSGSITARNLRVAATRSALRELDLLPKES